MPSLRDRFDLRAVAQQMRIAVNPGVEHANCVRAVWSGQVESERTPKHWQQTPVSIAEGLVRDASHCLKLKSAGLARKKNFSAALESTSM